MIKSYSLDDGNHPCLTCGTTAGKVFIHNPHRTEEFQPEIKYLNINQTITALTAGVLDPKTGKNILLVGTQTNLLA